MLEDEQIREKEGREMEIIKIATQKALDDLQQYHSYADRTLDKPFLTSESVQLDG